MLKVNLDKRCNRLLLLTPVEFFLQSYGSNQLGNDLFAFHSPLTGQITKVRHINHRFDSVTTRLLHDYKHIRQGLLNNTVERFSIKQAIEMSVLIEDYVQQFKNQLPSKYFSQLRFLDYKFRHDSGDGTRE